MNIEKIRRINFAALRKEHKLTVISEMTGIDYNYLLRMESGDRGFTEKKAREIEQSLDLPNMWMDTQHKNHNPILREAVKELEYVPDELLPAILAAIRALKKDE